MTFKTNPTASSDTAASTAPTALRNSALILKLLGRAKGTTLPEMMEPTGWQPHSTRAYLSRLRTKGMTIIREQRKSGETAYRLITGTGTAVNAAASPVT